MNSSMQFLVNKPDVVYEIFDDEIVIINLGNGNYFSLEKVGAEIWRLIENGANVNEVIEVITQLYESNRVNAEKAVVQFLEELKREELIVPCSSAKHEEIEKPKFNGENTKTIKLDFVTPTLHKYTDMQELLLLDPIHEVDETGWPKPKLDPTNNDG